MGSCVSSQPSLAVEDFVASVPPSVSSVPFTTTGHHRLLNTSGDGRSPALDDMSASGIGGHNHHNPHRIQLTTTTSASRHHKANLPDLATFGALQLFDGDDIPTGGSSISQEITGGVKGPYAPRTPSAAPRNPLQPPSQKASMAVFSTDLLRVDNAKYHSSSSTSGGPADRSTKDSDPLDASCAAAAAGSDAAKDSFRNDGDAVVSGLRNSMSVTDHNEGQGMMNSSARGLQALGSSNTPYSRVNSAGSIPNRCAPEVDNNEDSHRGPPTPGNAALGACIADDGAPGEDTATAATTATTAATASSTSTMSSVVVPWSALARAARPPPIIVSTPHTTSATNRPPTPPHATTAPSSTQLQSTPALLTASYQGTLTASFTTPTTQLPVLPAKALSAAVESEPKSTTVAADAPSASSAPPLLSGHRRAPASSIVTIQEPVEFSTPRPVHAFEHRRPTGQTSSEPVGSVPTAPRPPTRSKEGAVGRPRHTAGSPRRTITVPQSSPSKHWVTQQVSNLDMSGPPPGPTPFEAAADFLLFSDRSELQIRELEWEKHVHNSIAGKSWVISSCGWD